MLGRDLGTPDRNPLLGNPVFADSWSVTCAAILKEHLFLNTTKGESFSDFNRHLALHSLGDRPFATPDNIMRAFLLVDLLTELYLCENHLPDPMFKVTPTEEKPQAKAYQEAMLQSLGLGGASQEFLLSKHPRCKY